MILGTTPQSNIRPRVGSGVRARKCGERLRYTLGHTLVPQFSSHMCTVGGLMVVLGLVGGTFEFFHIGHQRLIETSLSHCDNLEIWVISDEIAQRKDPRTSSWKERCDYIQSNLSLEENSRVSFHKLVDKFGAAIYHDTASVIFCTSETVSNCISINQIRIKNGLSELSIIEVPRIFSKEGDLISSSRIRNGKIDRDGNFWLNDEFLNFDIHLSKEVERSLKDPFGTLFHGPETDYSIAINAARNSIEETQSPIIGVGDVTVKSLQDIGKIPSIGLIDKKTKRIKWDGFNDIDQSLYDHIIECNNPPGMLTKSLFESCKKAMSNWIENGEKSLILVDGEEDLAPLLLHILAPIRSVILYGQPNQGVVLRITGLDSKYRCQRLLSLFKQN